LGETYIYMDFRLLQSLRSLAMTMFRNNRLENIMEDRRKYKRITKCVMSWLKFAQDKRKKKVPSYPLGWDMVTTCDLGAGGMLFNYDKPVEIGTKVRLRVAFPFKDAPIDCVGNVLRTEKVDSYKHSSIYRIAAQFERISESNKGLIDKVANQMCA